MKLKLLQNVMIDGVVQNAGTTIDSDATGVAVDSMLHWGWAEKVKAPKADKSEPEAPVSEPDSPAPAEVVPPVKAPAKPKRTKTK